MHPTERPFLLLVPSLALAAFLVSTDATAETRCAAKQIQRAVPGGAEQPSLQIECDDPRDASEVDPATVCDAVPPDQRAACEQAADNRREALRKARLRAALRRGVPDDEIVERFDADAQELDPLRESAVQSGARSISSP